MMRESSSASASKPDGCAGTGGGTRDRRRFNEGAKAGFRGGTTVGVQRASFQGAQGEMVIRCREKSTGSRTATDRGKVLRTSLKVRCDLEELGGGIHPLRGYDAFVKAWKKNGERKDSQPFAKRHRTSTLIPADHRFLNLMYNK